MGSRFGMGASSNFEPRNPQPRDEGAPMIVDVHSHTPRYRTRDAVPDLPANAKWRPDKPMPTGYTWDDFLTVMAPVDRAICFNIAADPRPNMPEGLSPRTRASARQLNDETAAFVHAHPDKFIGFL